MKTPEQITEETLRELYDLSAEKYPTAEDAMQKVLDVADDQTAHDMLDVIRAAIEADRAQRSPRPTVYIVQNDVGDVVDAFQDADEATAAYQEGYSITEETPWAPGEYAAQRIEELTRMTPSRRDELCPECGEEGHDCRNNERED